VAGVLHDEDWVLLGRFQRTARAEVGRDGLFAPWVVLSINVSLFSSRNEKENSPLSPDHSLSSTLPALSPGIDSIRALALGTGIRVSIVGLEIRAARAQVVVVRNETRDDRLGSVRSTTVAISLFSN
jgi:hypothetical protein